MNEPATPSFAARFAPPQDNTRRASPQSQADQLIARSGHLIHKLSAKDTTGRRAYYFVYVEASRERVFLDALEGDGIVDLDTYGRVIASCYGDAPTEDVREFLKHKYGFDV